MPVQAERPTHRYRQILMQFPGNTRGDDIARPRHRKRGHWDAAGHGFQHHLAEGIRPAGKHHAVGLRHRSGEAVASEKTRPDDLGVRLT